MIDVKKSFSPPFALLLAGAALVIASCATMAPMVGGQRLELSGANEVPSVATSATGSATVDIKPDRSVTASVTVTGMPQMPAVYRLESNLVQPWVRGFAPPVFTSYWKYLDIDVDRRRRAQQTVSK